MEGAVTTFLILLAFGAACVVAGFVHMWQQREGRSPFCSGCEVPNSECRTHRSR